MIDEASLKSLDAQQLREVVRSLMVEVDKRDREIAFKQATIDKITHEMAVLKRLKFAAKSEHFNPEQKSLLEEAIDHSELPVDPEHPDWAETYLLDLRRRYFGAIPTRTVIGKATPLYTDEAGDGRFVWRAPTR